MDNVTEKRSSFLCLNAVATYCTEPPFALMRFTNWQSCTCGYPVSLASFLGTSTKIFYFAFPVPPALTGGISLAAGEKLITGCKINLSLSFVSQRYLSRVLLNMQAFSLLEIPAFTLIF